MKEAEKKYIKLLSAIRKQGGVMCEQVPHIFFPDDSLGSEGGYHAEKRLAIEICKKCPVQKLCADYALTAREPYGIWGGTLPTDR